MIARPVWWLLYAAVLPLALLDEPPAKSDAPADEARAAAASESKRKIAPDDLDLLKRLERQTSGDAEDGDPLDRIAERMRQVQERLTKADSGGDTQGLQREIVDDIDKLIRDIKKSAASKQSKQKRKTSDEQAKQQGEQQGEPKQGSQPKEGDTTAKPGPVSDEQRQAAQPLVRDVWGHLPDKLKEEMQQSFKEADLPKYRLLIERYFRAIAEQNDSRR